MADIEITDGAEEYTPEAWTVWENCALIFDTLEFEEKTNALAVVMYEGQLFVYDKDTFALCSLSELKKPKPPKGGGRLARVD